MLLSAVAELGTIGAVLPLLALIAHPQSFAGQTWMLLAFLGADSEGSRLAAVTIIFALFAIAAGFLRFGLARSTFRFSYSLAHELLLEIQRRLLLQPYSFHIERNSSTLVTALEKSEIVVFEVVLPFLQGASATVISLFIVGALVAIDPVSAIVACVAFAAICVGLWMLYDRQLTANSQSIARGVNQRMKIVQESLGGIRDVILDGSQSFYLQALDREDRQLADARSSTAIIANAPRFLLETVAAVVIALVALAASYRPGGFTAVLPLLGTLAFGGQRLIPLVQQIYRAWSTAAGNFSVVSDTLDLLRLPIEAGTAAAGASESLPLRKQIRVVDLGFTYPGRSAPALEGVSFELPAGAALALIGPTGSGKSTLADLLMGLLEPSRGEVRVDNVVLSEQNRRNWQRSIAHVPQSIFLADITIAKNIAVSRPDVPTDRAQIEDAAKQAQLHDFVLSLPAGYDTIVGERGVRLSGGQRQRLGIARAIYKDTPILVLDEATSALDEVTERAVIGTLETLRQEGRTMIIIAHRHSTIRHCDLVLRLDSGRLVECGPSSEFDLTGHAASQRP